MLRRSMLYAVVCFFVQYCLVLMDRGLLVSDVLSAFFQSTCLCSCSKVKEEGLLLCAPCPPPIISYRDFRDHAISRNLTIESVCVIAERCDVYGIDKNDCPPETTLAVGTYVIYVLIGVFSGLIIFILLIVFICRRRRVRGFEPMKFEEEKSRVENDSSEEGPSADVEHPSSKDIGSDEDIFYTAEENPSIEIDKPSLTIRTDCSDIQRQTSENQLDLQAFNYSDGIASDNTGESDEDSFFDAYQTIPFIDSVATAFTDQSIT